MYSVYLYHNISETFGPFRILVLGTLRRILNERLWLDQLMNYFLFIVTRDLLSLYWISDQYILILISPILNFNVYIFILLGLNVVFFIHCLRIWLYYIYTLNRPFPKLSVDFYVVVRVNVCKNPFTYILSESFLYLLCLS